MGTLFDYLSWRGDLSFEQDPLNEVDSLIFSLVSYIEFKGIVSEAHGGATVSLRAAANSFFARHPDPRKISMGLIVPKEIIKLLRAVRECRRFRSVGMKGYVNRIDTEVQTQFSAVTFCLGTGETVVAYRGTDDTLVGWKENFNMSFMDVVPAQAYAADYLNAAALHCTGQIYVTGHSKGGNLSVYAAIHCRPEVRKRLARVWCNDGPGFRTAWFQNPDYIDIKPYIRTLVPQSSLVGMLLEHDESYTVVKSRQVGLFQHDGLTWEVQGNAFLRVHDVTEESKRTNRALKEWLQNLSPEQRYQFCDALFRLLSSDNAATLTDLMSFKNRWILRSMRLDPQVRKTVLQTVQELIKINTKTLLNDLAPNGKKNKDTTK